MLKEQITEIEQSSEDYLKSRSSIVYKYQLVQRFQENTTLTSEMVSDIVERVYVDIDGVRVVSRLDVKVEKLAKDFLAKKQMANEDEVT